MKVDELAGIIETILFVSSGLVSISSIKKIVETEEGSVSSYMIREAIQLLRERYEKPESGISLVQVDGNLQLSARLTHNHYVEKILIKKKKKSLSQAALEVLSIVAYKQPITKLEIEEIRGVNSDSVINGLMEYGLLEEKGRLDRIGRPVLLGTTQMFLMEFGISKLSELPKISEELSYE